MGCHGCELYPRAAAILKSLDLVLSAFGRWPPGESKQIYHDLIRSEYNSINYPQRGHSPSLATTNVWHLRRGFLDIVTSRLGRNAARAAEKAICQAIACYAARLHHNRGRSIANPERGFNSGYAPAFELVTRFAGRVWSAAQSPDLRGKHRAEKPWLNGHPRFIFVSDMGDAFSRESDFDFLEREAIEPIRSPNGMRHVWCWLTKRPHMMARFGKRIGGFPQNVIAMTTLTGPSSLERIRALSRVPAAARGLSIEPLRDRFPARNLDLRGIDWVIVGGESGRREFVRAFDIEWAKELRDHCHKCGVAFFLKQLGRRPLEGGKVIALRDSHGGDWSEWSDDLRVRQMPSKR